MAFKKIFKAVLFSMLTASLVLPLGSLKSKASDENINIVSGLGYTVETGVGIVHSYGLQGTESDPEEKLLTDGKFSPNASYSQSAWHRFYRGYSRSVIFTLPEEKAVTGFNISVLQDNGAGVLISKYYELYVSENGEDWMLCHSYDATDMVVYTPERRLKITAKDIGRFKAKYIKVKFQVDVGAYLDEIEIYGGALDGTEAPFARYQDPYPYKNAYDPGVDGVKDMVLLYCGYKGDYDISFVQNTEEEMLYYCGYVDKNGEILDTMFDSFMFSALKGALPSGRKGNQGGSPPLMSDWQYYIDNIFDIEYNCGAIERALDRVKLATGKSDYKMKLVINMLYPNISPNMPFGDFDGDGVTNFCRNKDEQLALFAWFMDTVIQTMEERGYNNITLGGFYWEAESIATKRGEEEFEFVKSVSDLVHERDLDFFWAPFLYGNGFDRVDDLGFDCAMMQPNLPFLDYAEPETLYEFDEVIRKYGLGIDIEIHWNASWLSAADNAKRISQFYDYLEAGYYLGFMKDAAHCYYQNSDPGTFYHFAKSNSVKLRAIYDDLYAFIKHTFTPRVPSLKSRDYSVEPGKTLNGYISTDIPTNDPTYGRVEYVLVTPPENGALEFRISGGFTYKPNDSFTGEDMFTVLGKGTFMTTKPLDIKINVAFPAEEISGEPSEESSIVTSEETTSANPAPKEEKSKFGVKEIGLAAAAAVIAAALIAVIIKRKKPKK